MPKFLDALLNNPKALKRANGYQTIFFALLIPVSYISGWINSLPYVSLLSLVALFLGALSAWQASRTEVLQDDSEDGLTEEDRKWIIKTLKEIRDEPPTDGV